MMTINDKARETGMKIKKVQIIVLITMGLLVGNVGSANAVPCQIINMVIDQGGSIINTSGGFNGQGVGDLNISGSFDLVDDCGQVYFANVNVVTSPASGFVFPEYPGTYDGFNFSATQANGSFPANGFNGTFDGNIISFTGNYNEPCFDCYQYNFTISAGKDSDVDGFADVIDPCPADPLNLCTTTYEDGEDALTEGWDTHDNEPIGGTVTNVYDATRNSRVIELAGTGISNAYKLQNSNGTPWNNPVQFSLNLSVNFAEYFAVLVHLNTSNGPRLLTYVPIDNSPLGSKVYVTHGLGSSIIDGQWHDISRDLQADLAAAQPGNTILSVERMIIRGSGRLDDISLH